MRVCLPSARSWPGCANSDTERESRARRGRSRASRALQPRFTPHRRSQYCARRAPPGPARSRPRSRHGRTDSSAALISDYSEARTRTPVSTDPDRQKPGTWASSAAIAGSAVPDCPWCRGALLPNVGLALGVLTVHPRIAASPP